MNGSDCLGSNRNTQTCNTGTCGGSCSRNNTKLDTCSEFFLKIHRIKLLCYSLILVFFQLGLSGTLGAAVPIPVEEAYDEGQGLVWVELTAPETNKTMKAATNSHVPVSVNVI